MNKPKGIAQMLLLALLVVVVGCAPRAADVTTAVQVEKVVELPAREAAPAPGAESVADEGGSTGAAVTQNYGEQMIIRTANMSLIVEDTEKAVSALEELAKSYKGYVADANKWYEGDRLLANLTLRVPAQSLDEVRAMMRKLALKVETENSNSQDVTEEYTDLRARLRNLELTEKELQTLLTEVRENRSKAEDILAIYRQLTEIRGQIEQLKGRQQYLERMTALATLQIQLRPKDAPRAAVEKYTWNPLVTASEAMRLLVRIGQFLVDAAITLAILSPLVIIPVLVLWLLVRLLRRGRKGKSV